jgi:hypothetical protein
MCTASGVHESIVQCKICCLAFREAVANDVGEEWSWIDDKSRTDSTLHLAIPNEFELWIIRQRDVKRFRLFQ